MKISVIIPTRRRPYHLEVVIGALHDLCSRMHDITYVVGCDDDDIATIGMAHVISTRGPKVETFCTRRMGSLGNMVNVMAAKYPADVYCSLCDDVEPLTPGWDHILFLHWAQRPDGVWWWRTDKARPATYAIVSDKWYRASGRIFTDYFPFWWDDVWLLQVWNMASRQIPMQAEVWLKDRSFATHRMRDLQFWAKFYESRRTERIMEANRITKALGWPLEPLSLRQDGIPLQIGDLKPGFLEEAPKIEKAQGEVNSPPSPEYVAAKRRAEALMAQQEAA